MPLPKPEPAPDISWAELIQHTSNQHHLPLQIRNVIQQSGRGYLDHCCSSSGLKVTKALFGVEVIRARHDPVT